jgi:hypothetical protein
MIGKFLPIQADIYHIERIIIVKKWNVGEFAVNFLLRINSLNAYPILNFCLCFGFGIAFEPYSDTFCVLLDQWMERHIDFSLSSSMS